MPKLKPATQLDRAIANGLTFGDCVKAFALSNDARADRLIALARDTVHRDGEIEIDDVTITSGSDDGGDYVLAWVWVADDQDAQP